MTMALHFPLYINGQQIGHFQAVRISGTTDPDSINTYSVITVNFTDGPIGRHTTVEHRYGDGAWELIRKSLAEIETHGAPLPTTE